MVMHEFASFFGSGLFFVPFLYVLIYLLIERGCSQFALVQTVLKIFTVLGGLALTFYACTVPTDVAVLMLGRGGQKTFVPASIFFAIVGIAAAALPIYSKHIRFSNGNG